MSKVNINLANVEALTQINGIGEVLATRIITYRETVHLFDEIIELTAVPGISERMVRQFEDQVTLEDAQFEDDELDMAFVTETAVMPKEEASTANEATDETDAEGSSTDVDDEVSDAVEEVETAVMPDEEAPATDEYVDEASVEEIPAAVVDEVVEVMGEAETAVIPDEEELATGESIDEAEGEEVTTDDAGEVEESETAVMVDDEDSATDTVAEPIESRSELEKPQTVFPQILPDPTRLIEEQEPPMTDNPTSEPETGIEEITDYVTSEEPMARRRGCLFVIIGTVAGAILGTALTLALLASLNEGTLRFANAEVEGQLESQIEEANLTIEAMSAELDMTNENLNVVATRTGATAVELNTAVSDIEQSLDGTQNDVATAAADIEGLEETAVELDERIDTISSAAETFNQFLDGMRDLLFELQGDPSTLSTSTVTPESTATGTTAEPTKPSTPTSTAPESTRIPTRTPRPTATPLTLPTTTPGQQP